MASTFFLKNMPARRVLELLAPRYPELRVDSMEAYLSLLRVTGEILTSTDAQMTRMKTSQGQFRVLMELNLDPSAAPAPSELAARIGVTRATITGLLDGLERAGYLRRERADAGSDRRSIRIRLAPKGSRFIERIIPDRCRRIAGLMEQLTVSEQKTLARLLEKVAQGLPAFREP